jgi:hypothetical protein
VHSDSGCAGSRACKVVRTVRHTLVRPARQDWPPLLRGSVCSSHRALLAPLPLQTMSPQPHTDFIGVLASATLRTQPDTVTVDHSKLHHHLHTCARVVGCILCTPLAHVPLGHDSSADVEMLAFTRQSTLGDLNNSSADAALTPPPQQSWYYTINECDIMKRVWSSVGGGAPARWPQSGCQDFSCWRG